MKYSVIASFVLAAVHATARPQDAPEVPSKGGCVLNEVLIGELDALEAGIRNF